MCKRIRAIVSLLLLGLLLQPAVPVAGLNRASHPSQQAPAPYVEGEILVRWRASVTAGAARAAILEHGLSLLREIVSLRIARLGVPAGREWTFIERLASSPLVEFAEPNYWAYAATDIAYPNDPDWLKQWNIRRINASSAWPLCTGNPGVVVAVLDSGVDASHPDLGANLVAGYDFVNDDADPMDDYGHGTHVSGILGARFNNSLGVAGVAMGASIMPLKVLNNRGAGTYADISAGIEYAATHGAAIVNLSLGGASASGTLELAVRSAYAAGALLVASTGNQGQEGINYPARYAEVMAVAATDHYDRWPSYSNWGSEVDLAAPGGTSTDQVWSTWPGGYDWEYGTSMAAPHVSGAAALMWGVNPDLTRDDVISILFQTADRVGQHPGGGTNIYLGHGRVDVYEALRRALPPGLTVQPQRLVFLGDSRQAPRAQQLVLGNESSQPLLWEAQKASGGSWLNLVPPLTGDASYEDASALNAVTSTGGLGFGLYQASLRISSSTVGAQGVPRTVPAVLSLVPSLTRIYLPSLQSAHTEFRWLDATSGTRLALGDEMSTTVDLPWYFPFYENSYSRLWVGDNGFVSFRQGYAGRAPDDTVVYTNSCLPSANQPNDVIYAFWDDLDPSRGGGIYVKSIDSNTVVIEWFQVPHWQGVFPETFEIILHRSGRITLQYLTVGNDSSVTVGVENYDGTMAWQWLCDGKGTRLSSKSAVRFEPPPLPW